MKRFLILFIFVFAGFGTLRQENKLLNHLAEVNTSVQQTTDQRQNWHSQLSDSLFSETDVVVWPKGKISISATGSLEGEVDKIQIRKKELQQRKIVAGAEASQKILLNTKVQAAAQMQQKEKFKSGYANTLLWCGVGLMIAAGGMLFLKLCKI